MPGGREEQIQLGEEAVKLVKVAPSILSADLSCIGNEVRRVQTADYIHVDVMDGSYVPNITFGSNMVSALSGMTDKPLDVHLMIVNPELQIRSFMEAGADILTIHPDATRHLHRHLSLIKELGGKAGVALNPSDPICLLENLIDIVDLVLIMTVNPGFGGQAFIESQLMKIAEVREMTASSGRDIIIEVDGGMNAETGARVRRAGADMIVAGTYIFSSLDPEEAIRTLRG